MIVMPPEKIKSIQLGGFCSLKSLGENNENEDEMHFYAITSALKC